MMRMRLTTRIALAVGFFLTYTVVATQIFLRWSGMLQAHCGVTACFEWPLYQWWFYLVDYLGDGDYLTGRYLLLSGGGGAAVIVLIAIALFKPTSAGWPLTRSQLPTSTPTGPIRAPTDNYGHARWATVREMRRRWPGPDPVYGGVVIGEAYDPCGDKGPFYPHDSRTWGRGGKKRLLISPCYEGSTHGIVTAASGGFKSMCFASTLLYWKTSAVVHDPAGELSAMVGDARQRMGHRVFVLNTETAETCGFNVLDWINTQSKDAEGDIGAVVEWVCGATPPVAGSSRFFKNRGKAIVKCFIAHMLWDPALNPELKTLTTVRSWISSGQQNIQGMLKVIAKPSAEGGSHSRLARLIASGFDKVPDDTWGGIVASADDDTSWLTTLTNAQLVSGNSFRTAELVGGNIDVFISLKLKVLYSAPGLARCIVGALLNAVYEADGNVRGRVLFLLDEAARLGHMSILKVARDAGRKYGMTLVLGYQSEAQIEEQWGGRQGREEWYQVVDWRSYSVINELSTAKTLSEACGTYGGLSWSESFRRRFALQRNLGNINYSERPIPLIRPQEILSEMRRDCQIIAPGSGELPVRCGRAMYFRRRELVPLVRPNRFAKKDHDVSEIVPLPDPAGDAVLDDLESPEWPAPPATP